MAPRRDDFEPDRPVPPLQRGRTQERARSWQRASTRVDPVGGEEPQEPAHLLTAGERTFRRLLVNTLISGVTSSFLWFALTFWVYLETRSVVATGVIGGAFSISSAVLGPVFGTFVDRHRKHTAMCWRRPIVGRLLRGRDRRVRRRRRRRPARARAARGSGCSSRSTLLGSVAGQMRGIALSTCVTLLVPEDRRDRANGMVGTVTGVSFAITSVFSGLVIGLLGMGWAYYVVARAHRRRARPPRARSTIDEPEPEPARRRRPAAASTSAARSRRSAPCPG